MNFEQQIYYSCAAYSSIHPNRAAALNHLFCVIGNGYEWANGELVEVCGDTTTKSGRRLSMKAAISQVFRNRRKSNAQRAAWERNHERDEKKALKHKKDCPAVMVCTCGFLRGAFKIKKGEKGCTNWCRSNFPEDQKCDCGAQARIDAAKAQNAQIDAQIERLLEQIKKAPKKTPKEAAAERKRLTASSKKTKAEIRERHKWEYRVPSDIKQRVKDTTFDHWYPLSEYSRMVTFPDDIKPEWLDAVIETAALVIAHPPKIDKQHPVECQQHTVAIAEKCLARALALKAARSL